MKLPFAAALLSLTLFSPALAGADECDQLLSYSEWKMKANHYFFDIRLAKVWKDGNAVRFYGGLLDYFRDGRRNDLVDGFCLNGAVRFTRLEFSDGVQNWQKYWGSIYWRGNELKMDGNFSHAGDNSGVWSAFVGRWR